MKSKSLMMAARVYGALSFSPMPLDERHLVVPGLFHEALVSAGRDFKAVYEDYRKLTRPERRKVRAIVGTMPGFSAKRAHSLVEANQGNAGLSKEQWDGWDGRFEVYYTLPSPEGVSSAIERAKGLGLTVESRGLVIATDPWVSEMDAAVTSLGGQPATIYEFASETYTVSEAYRTFVLNGVRRGDPVEFEGALKALYEGAWDKALKRGDLSDHVATQSDRFEAFARLCEADVDAGGMTLVFRFLGNAAKAQTDMQSFLDNMVNLGVAANGSVTTSGGDALVVLRDVNDREQARYWAAAYGIYSEEGEADLGTAPEGAAAAAPTDATEMMPESFKAALAHYGESVRRPLVEKALQSVIAMRRRALTEDGVEAGGGAATVSTNTTQNTQPVVPAPPGAPTPSQSEPAQEPPKPTEHQPTQAASGTEEGGTAVTLPDGSPVPPETVTAIVKDFVTNLVKQIEAGSAVNTVTPADKAGEEAGTEEPKPAVPANGAEQPPAQSQNGDGQAAKPPAKQGQEAPAGQAPTKAEAMEGVYRASVALAEVVEFSTADEAKKFAAFVTAQKNPRVTTAGVFAERFVDLTVWVGPNGYADETAVVKQIENWSRGLGIVVEHLKVTKGGTKKPVTESSRQALLAKARKMLAEKGELAGKPTLLPADKRTYAQWYEVACTSDATAESLYMTLLRQFVPKTSTGRAENTILTASKVPNKPVLHVAYRPGKNADGDTDASGQLLGLLQSGGFEEKVTAKRLPSIHETLTPEAQKVVSDKIATIRSEKPDISAAQAAAMAYDYARRAGYKVPEQKSETVAAIARQVLTEQVLKTTPDPLDAHIHEVHLDSNGDGSTTDAGTPPHHHAVIRGVVVEWTDGKVTSAHSGSLVEATRQCGMEPGYGGQFGRRDGMETTPVMDPTMSAPEADKTPETLGMDNEPGEEKPEDDTKKSKTDERRFGPVKPPMTGMGRRPGMTEVPTQIAEPRGAMMPDPVQATAPGMTPYGMLPADEPGAGSNMGMAGGLDLEVPPGMEELPLDTTVPPVQPDQSAPVPGMEELPLDTEVPPVQPGQSSPMPGMEELPLDTEVPPVQQQQAAAVPGMSRDSMPGMSRTDMARTFRTTAMGRMRGMETPNEAPVNQAGADQTTTDPADVIGMAYQDAASGGDGGSEQAADVPTAAKEPQPYGMEEPNPEGVEGEMLPAPVTFEAVFKAAKALGFKESVLATMQRGRTAGLNSLAILTGLYRGKHCSFTEAQALAVASGQEKHFLGAVGAGLDKARRTLQQEARTLFRSNAKTSAVATIAQRLLESPGTQVALLDHAKPEEVRGLVGAGFGTNETLMAAIERANKEVEKHLHDRQSALSVARRPAEFLRDQMIEQTRIKAGEACALLSMSSDKCVVEWKGRKVSVPRDAVGVLPTDSGLSEALDALERGADISAVALRVLNRGRELRPASNVPLAEIAATADAVTYYGAPKALSEALTKLAGKRVYLFREGVTVDLRRLTPASKNRIAALAEKFPAVRVEGAVVTPEKSLMEQLDIAADSADTSAVGEAITAILGLLKGSRSALTDAQHMQLMKAKSVLAAVGSKKTAKAAEKLDAAITVAVEAMQKALEELSAMHDAFSAEHAGAGTGAAPANGAAAPAAAPDAAPEVAATPGATAAADTTTVPSPAQATAPAQVTTESLAAEILEKHGDRARLLHTMDNLGIGGIEIEHLHEEFKTVHPKMPLRMVLPVFEALCQKV